MKLHLENAMCAVVGALIIAGPFVAWSFDWVRL